MKKGGGIYEYYPAIIGINIDNKRIFVWSPKRAGDKYIIDIYNNSFKLLDRRSFFNYTINRVIIKNGFLYIPDIIPPKGETISRIMGMAYNLGVSEKKLKFKLEL